MQSQLRISKRQAKKQDVKDRRKQAKEQFVSIQRQIQQSLPFQVPTEPRIYITECKFGPKHILRLNKEAQQAIEDKPLVTIPHNGTITHAGIPNPNFMANSDIPRYAAIRFSNCVSMEEAQKMLQQVKELKDVSSIAGFFLLAY